MGDPFDYSDSDGRTVSVERATAGSDFHAVLETVRYEGVPLPNVAHDFKNDPQTDPSFRQAYSERNAVAYLLVAAGYHDFNLLSRPPPAPDVRVEFANGSAAHIETAEVIESPSARFDGILRFVNVGIRRAFQQDSALDEKLRGHYVGVRAWMTADGKYDPHGMVDEFLRFLRAADLETLPQKEMVCFTDTYPALCEISAKYYLSRSTAITIPRFDPDAHSFGPESLANQVLSILKQKRELGSRYRGSPLWLALYMSDPLGVPEMSLEVMAGTALDFSPFSKLLVGDQRSVMVYSVK